MRGSHGHGKIHGSTTRAFGQSLTTRRRPREGRMRISTSVAAEKALDVGDENEDSLLMGSRRFAGETVRRQLRKSPNMNSSRRGSQRFLQSMRFWDSIRPPKTKNILNPNSTENENNYGQILGGIISNRSGVSVSLDHTNTHTNSTPTAHARREKTLEQQQLLSMRVEASRSMRRQRHGPSLMDWFVEEPKATVAAIKGTKLPWRKNHTNQKLRSKNIQKMMEQATPPQHLNSEIDNYEEDLDHDIDLDGNMLCRRFPKISTRSDKKTKTKKKTIKKRWRLWLPNRKEPIELIHPSASFDLDSSLQASSANQSTRHIPADVQLRQSMAKQQKQTLFEKASRHLELQLESTEETTAPSNHTTTSSADLRASLHASSEHFRSTRLDVHSNQPLLVRRPRIAVSKAAFGAASDLSDDDDTIEEFHACSNHGINTSNSSTNQRNSPIVAYVPKQIQLNQPKSRGSILVQQISGLSVGFSPHLPHDLDDSQDQSDNQSMSSSSFAKNGTNDDQDQNSYVGTNNDDDNSEDDENIFYSVQDLLDSRNQQAVFHLTRRRTFGATNDNDYNNQNLLFRRGEDQDPVHDEAGSAELGLNGLSTCVAPSNSSRRTQNLHSQRQYTTDSSHSADTLSSSFMPKQSGVLRLECVSEVEEDSITESEHISREDPYVGVDPWFGNSTKKLNQQHQDAPVSTKYPSTRVSSAAQRRSIASTHASHESSAYSFENLCNHLNLSMNSLDPNEMHNRENAADHLAIPPHSDHFHGSFISDGGTRFRRKALPPGALGGRQHGIRGGVLSDSAREFLEEQQRSAKELENSITMTSSGRGSESPEATKPALGRRCVSLPERVTRGKRLNSAEEEEPGREIGVVASSPSKARLTTKKIASKCGKERERDEKSNMNESGGDWWEDPPAPIAGMDDSEKGFEIVWNDVTKNGCTDDCKTIRTKSDWWEVKKHDDAAVKETHSYVSNLYVIWDENGEDPFIYVGDSPPENEELNGHHSVRSEPAHMGLFDDSKEDILGDPSKNRWLMAWDDLALL